MLIEENTLQTDYALSAYEHGILEIGGKQYDMPICLRNGKVEMLDKGLMLSDLKAEDFFQTASSEEWPEVILVGTGEKQQFLHPKIIAEVAEKGIGLECMNTHSACRTLVLLQAESRSVWAWLWP